MAKRVLIIDDEIAILKVIQSCLEDLADWETLTANSGHQGIILAKSQHPDGILLDVSMPGMDGFQTLQQLKSDVETQDIPVVFLTARVQLEDREKFAQLKVAGTIVKPFDPFALISLVAEAFHW